jgi:hypothetical protein
MFICSTSLGDADAIYWLKSVSMMAGIPAAMTASVTTHRASMSNDGMLTCPAETSHDAMQ